MRSAFSFSWRCLEPGDPLPPREAVFAVFLVGFIDKNHIIAVQNERGWDLPGGHLLPHESLTQGLAREAFEETGALFAHAEPFIVLSSNNASGIAIGFVSHSCQIQPIYQPVDDALAREILSIETMIERYFGDKTLISSILQSALTFPAE